MDILGRVGRGGRGRRKREARDGRAEKTGQASIATSPSSPIAAVDDSFPLPLLLLTSPPAIAVTGLTSSLLPRSSALSFSRSRSASAGAVGVRSSAAER